LEGIIEERRKLLAQDIEDLSTNADDALNNDDDNLLTGDHDDSTTVSAGATVSVASHHHHHHHTKTSQRSRGDTRKVVETGPAKNLDDGNHSDLEQSDVLHLAIDYETAGHVDQGGDEKAGAVDVIEDMDVVADGDIEIGAGDFTPKKCVVTSNEQLPMNENVEHDTVTVVPLAETLADSNTEQQGNGEEKDRLESVEDNTADVTEGPFLQMEEERKAENVETIELPQKMSGEVEDGTIIGLDVKKVAKKSSGNNDDDNNSERENTTSLGKRTRGHESGSKNADVEKGRTSLHRKRPRAGNDSSYEGGSEVEQRSERKRKERREISRHHRPRREERDRSEEDEDKRRRRHGNDRDSKRRQKDASKGRDNERHTSGKRLKKVAATKKIVPKESEAHPVSDSDSDDVDNDAPQ